jgi:hypothetical protein
MHHRDTEVTERRSKEEPLVYNLLGGNLYSPGLKCFSP